MHMTHKCFVLFHELSSCIVSMIIVSPENKKHSGIGKFSFPRVFLSDSVRKLHASVAGSGDYIHLLLSG